MTKTEFFDLCRNHETSSGVELEVVRARDGRNKEHIVCLEGCWFDGTVPDFTLYHPLPGRQRADCYATVILRCEKAVVKFRRWLEEWKETKPCDK